MEEKILDDVELYLFFKDLWVPGFEICYNKEDHLYNISRGKTFTKEPILREDLEKFVLYTKKWILKYFPKREIKPI